MNEDWPRKGRRGLKLMEPDQKQESSNIETMLKHGKNNVRQKETPSRYNCSKHQTWKGQDGATFTMSAHTVLCYSKSWKLGALRTPSSKRSSP